MRRVFFSVIAVALRGGACGQPAGPYEVLRIVKVEGRSGFDCPTSFAVEKTLQTMRGAKIMAADTKPNRAYAIAAEFGPRGRGPQQEGAAADGRWYLIRSRFLK